MRELMPRTPFLLPGVGAQGGDVRTSRPLRTRARRRPRDRVAVDRQRLRERGGAAADAARAEAERLRELAWALPDAGTIIGRDDPSQSRATAGAAGAGGLRRRAFVVVTSPVTTAASDDARRQARRERAPRPHAGRSGKAPKQRQTYTVKPGDTPSSIAEQTDVSLQRLAR